MPFQQLKWAGGWNGGFLADARGNPVQIRRGDSYHFLWPDGSELEHVVQMRRRSGQDFDMGHSTNWSVEYPVVVATVHGVAVDVEVIQLQIDLT